MITNHQRYRQTDGQIDGRHAIPSPGFDKISWRGREWPRDQGGKFWWRSWSPSGSRSLKSEIRIHRIIELPTDFGEILRRAEVWPRDQLIITFWWRSASLYPDPGVRSGSRSGSGKNCHNILLALMLAFGGGLCSLSRPTFSWIN